MPGVDISKGSQDRIENRIEDGYKHLATGFHQKSSINFPQYSRRSGVAAGPGTNQATGHSHVQRRRRALSGNFGKDQSPTTLRSRKKIIKGPGNRTRESPSS